MSASNSILSIHWRNNSGLRLLMRMGLIIGIVALQACAVAPADKVSYAATRPRPDMMPAPTQGAIYQAGQEVTLFNDTKAHRVGDIITVVLAEQTVASKSADTTTSKKQDIAMDTPSIFGAPLSFNMPGNPKRDLSLGATISGNRDFTGAGDSNQSNKLIGNIAVTVAEVLSNGNLIVRGEKRVTINQGDEYIRLSGIVRPADIDPDNTISSTLVADAKISYTGNGLIDDANSNGWLARFFNSKWWPF